MALPLDPSWFFAQTNAPVNVAAGDVDGDELSDIVVASGNRLYLFLGHPNGPLAAPDWTFTAPLTTDHLGDGLAIADLDRDGYAEILVGSPRYVPHVSTGQGAIFVFAGSPTGPGQNANFTWVGPQEFSELGSSLAVADVDDDGFPDIIAGASGYAVADVIVGAVFVYPGIPIGLPTGAATLAVQGADYGALGTDLAVGTFDAGPGDIAVADSVTNSAIVVRGGSITGFRSREWQGDLGFASSLAGGDFDNDGLDDVAIGAWEGPRDCSLDGPVGVWVYDGGVTAPSATASFSASAGWEGTAFGYSVAAGHFDDDGFADLIVGAPCLGDGAVAEFRGSTGGPASRPTWWVQQELLESADQPEFGSQLASAGDVNGDGLDDLLVGGDHAGVWLFLSEDDKDDDGVADDDDCAPTDPARHPFAFEIPGDGIDEDCDGIELCYMDEDGDGHGGPRASGDLDCDDAGEDADALDCDDDDADITPEAAEIPQDGVDQDCDGFEDCPADADRDGWAGDDLAEGPLSCVGDGLEPDHEGDCDDANADVNPEVDEVAADGVDNDCEGTEICYADIDADGYGGDTPSVSFDLACDAAGEATTVTDCDDEDGFAHPGADEIPADGVDQDCDGEELCFVDVDADGFGTTETVASRENDCRDPGTAPNDDDCDDTSGTVRPDAPEVNGDGIDQDCDGEDPPPDDACVDSGDCEPEPTCGCATPPTPGSAALIGLLALLSLTSRRRSS